MRNHGNLKSRVSGKSWFPASTGGMNFPCVAPWTKKTREPVDALTTKTPNVCRGPHGVFCTSRLVHELLLIDKLKTLSIFSNSISDTSIPANRSSRGGLFPARPPLRTVLESFPSYGSSRFNRCNRTATGGNRTTVGIQTSYAECQRQCRRRFQRTRHAKPRRLSKYSM